MKHSFPASVLAVALVALAGCGGGSGGDGNGDTTQNPAFAITNAEREHCCFGTLAQSAALDRSATAHMGYMVQNNVVAHTEESGKPGFTGVLPANRAVAAGYGSTAIGEVISFPLMAAGDTAAAVRRLFAAPYHQMLMLDSARDIGIGAAPYRGVAGLTMDFGFRPTGTPAPASVLTYPCEGTTGVLPFNRNESPSPLPEQHDPSWGQPILVRGAADLRVKSASITGPQGSVAIQVIYGDDQTADPHGQFAGGWASVLPVQLAPNTQYAASVSWTARSQSGSSNFNFTTGP